MKPLLAGRAAGEDLAIRNDGGGSLAPAAAANRLQKAARSEQARGKGSATNQGAGDPGAEPGQVASPETRIEKVGPQEQEAVALVGDLHLA